MMTCTLQGRESHLDIRHDDVNNRIADALRHEGETRSSRHRHCPCTFIQFLILVLFRQLIQQNRNEGGARLFGKVM